MKLQRLAWCAVLLIALSFPSAAEARRRPAERGTPLPPHDPFSASEPAAVRTVHLDLDLYVDFETRRLIGTATHTIENLSGTSRFVLDTRELLILEVTVDEMPALWSLGEATARGQALTIAITPQSRSVRVRYESTLNGSGITWFEPMQTLDDAAPFVYTLGQPDRTRNWLPIQDTPGVRMRYDATVRVPPGLMAVMSARSPRVVSPDGVYRFEMPYPIPPYLIALAAGRFEFAPLDERTGVYAEPGVMDDALWDLQYLPEMVDVAEQILGPYPFERYDVLLLPPGFSAGGMEHPMVNFINVASAVRGDRESPAVPNVLLAHELAHSWAGDSVTCATWSDTWLNEGFATYYSARILEEMVSAERAEIGFWWDLTSYEDYVRRVEDRFEVLHREFGPNDTLSIFTPTNYRKGSVFLKTLEDHMGREEFDRFARSYFARFAMRWVDERAFLEHLSAFDLDAEAVRLHEWIYSPGLPANVTAPRSSALWDRIGVEAARFRSGTAARHLQTADWSSFEHDLFLWQITESIPARIAELDAAFGYSWWRTPSTHWFLAVADDLYGPGIPMLERYLRQGTWNSIAIYQRLARTPKGMAWARAFYAGARPHYAAPIQQTIDQILQGSAAGSAVLRRAA